jgi:Xaa-Pro aminopeptidase
MEVHKERLSKLQKALKGKGLDGTLIVPGPNMVYYTGVRSLLLERALVLAVPAQGSLHMVSPELEAGPYRRSPADIEVHAWTDSEGPLRAVSETVAGAGIRRDWGVEGKVPFLFLDLIIKGSKASFSGCEHLLQEIREVKDAEEVRLLRKAGRVLSDAFERFPGLLKEGMEERAVAKAATDAIYEEGATSVDDMLVQSGPSAADPHSLAGKRKVRKGEGVVFDVGATFEGYYADITRTICLGNSKELEAVYSKVLEAEESGVKASRAGVTVGSIDAAARGALKRAGLSKYFIHRTGHGLGLEVHEAPYIVEGGREKVRDGMCFTVEPGVYVPGKLGVRIEDNILVESGSGKLITDTPKDYGWWK